VAINSCKIANTLKLIKQLKVVKKTYNATDLYTMLCAVRIMEIKFETVQEFVSWLIENPTKEIADGYGRKWKYRNFKFYFKDIGTKDEYQEGIKCLHLYQTPLYALS